VLCKDNYIVVILLRQAGSDFYKTTSLTKNKLMVLPGWLMMRKRRRV
jgi:hypothetical protein